MKTPSFKIILLVLILVVSNILLVTIEKKPKFIINSDGTYTSKQTKDYKWEYIKDRLFSGKGEGEYVYKLNPLVPNAPILISLNSATKQDSLAVNEIIDELREIIPNRTIDYLDNFAGISYSKLDRSGNKGNFIKGISSYKLVFSTIQLNFNKRVKSYDFREEKAIETLLPDGSIIERTNPARDERLIDFPSKIWFQLKTSLPFDKRKKYIQYELLRTLCYIYPPSRRNYKIIGDNKKGVFFTLAYIPHKAELNEYDKFLLQKLYENDFLKQFKTYLRTSFSWIYANHFLNISFTKTIAWSINICIGLLAFSLLFSFLSKRKFKYVFLNYFVPIYFIMLYLMNSILIYVFITDINDDFTLMHLLVGFTTASIGAPIISLILFFIETKWIYKITNFSVQLIFKMVFTLLVFNIPIAIILYIKGYLEGFIEFYLPIFIFTIIIAVGRGILIYLNNISESLVRQKDVELSKLKQLNAQAETKLLQSQINPHFLYNSLNSIASLAPIDAVKTQKMAHSLSDLFKYSINRKGKEMSAVKDEIEMVTSYLDIEKIRFGDRLQFDIEVDETLLNHDIPLFLIQPLVENAVKHGISQNEGEGTIRLKIKKKENELSISVSDNGPDFPEGLVSGHGLQTVYDLLRLSYGDSAALNWTNTPEKTITITIPDTV